MSFFQRTLIGCAAILSLGLMAPTHAADVTPSASLGGADFSTVFYGPDPAIYGELITYTIEMSSGGPGGVTVDGSFSNLDPGSLADLDPFSQTVTNFFDDGLGGGFVPDGSWDCNASTGTFSCSPNNINGGGTGDLPPGTHQFDITVRVNNPMPPSMNIFNLDLTTTFGSPLSVPTTIQQPIGGTTLQITQGLAQNPQFPVAGDPLEYLIEVSNVGSATADPFFTLDVGSADASSFGFVSGPFMCSPITGGISCFYDDQVGGPFAMGESRTLVLSALSPPPINQLGTFITNVNLTPGSLDTVAGTNPLPIQTNNDATITTMITPPSDPTVLGDQLVYTLSVNNLPGGAAARDVLIDFFADDDFFSDTATFDSMGGTNWMCSGPLRSNERSPRGSGINQVCTYNLDLAPGATTTPLTVVINGPTDPMATQYQANIFQAAFNYGGSPGDFQDVFTTLTAPGGGESDMALSFPDTTISVNNGDLVPVPVDVSNLGPDNADMAMVQLSHGPGLQLFNNDGGPDWTCQEISPGTEECTYDPGTFTSPGASQLVVNYLAGGQSPGPETLTATVSSTNIDNNSGNNTDSVQIDIVTPPNFFIDVIPTPEPAQADAPLNYAVAVSGGIGIGNNPRAERGLTFNNVVVTAQLPAGWSYLGFTQPQGDWNCSAAGQTVTCNNPSILAGFDDQVDIQVQTADANGQFSVPFNATATGEIPFALNVISTVTGASGVDLELIRESTVDSVQIGDEFEFQYTVNNIGGSAATGLVVNETLPDGIVYIGSTGSEWACQPNGQDIRCSFLVNPLVANDSTGFNVQLQAPEFEGPISSTAVLTQNEIDINPGNNVDNTTVTVVQRPPVDLVLDKTSSVSTVLPGESFQYQLSVTNVSGNPSTNVRIEDMLPAGVGYIGFSGADFMCTEASGMVACTAGIDLQPGDNRTVTLDVTAPMNSGTIINTATVFSAEADTQAADNTSSAEVAVGGNGADLAISLVASVSSVAVNQDLEYTITVLNQGPETASDIQLQGMLGAGFVLESTDNQDWSCSSSGTISNGSTFTCNRSQSLEAGASSSLILSGFVAAESGTLQTSATVSSSTSDTDISNNSASVSTAFTSGGDLADLLVTKVDSKDPVLPGETFDYLITVSNLGLGTARTITLTDQLPDSLIINNVAAPTDVNCQLNGNLLTCGFNNPLPNGIDKLITVTVTAPDDEQVLSNSVSVITLSQDSDLSNNMDVEETTVSRTPSQDQLRDALGGALGGLDDPLLNDNIEPVSDLCSSPPPSLVEFCGALFGALNDGQSGDAADAIRSIVGLQTKSQNTSLVEASAVQFRNIDARMSQNRGGAVGFSVSGLNIRYGDENLPVSFMQTADDDEPEISSAGLVKPWGFFANGTISMGEQDNETNQVGYDFDTYGITAGVDYRFSSKFIVGAAVGYADYESDFVDGSTLETDGLTLHLYSSYYPSDRLYIDGRLSVGSQDFNQRRPINFTLGDFSVNDLAIGDTEADQLAFALSSGYNFNRDGWNITPSISLSYLDAEIDGFTETGTDFALIYDKQNVESLIFGASLNVSRAISMSKGILTPTFDVSYHHESSNDDNNINSQILGSSASSSFFVDADSPDRNYGSAGLGVVYITSNGKQLYFNYREVLGISGFSRSTFNAGFRMEF